MKRFRSEAGAAAVEFALVVPLLLIILLGIVEFGRVFNAQIQVTSAARESVRVMAIQKEVDVAVSTAISSAPGLNPALAPAQISVTPCTTSSETTVTITYSIDLLAGLFADAIPLTGRSVMRCGG
ncbi:TadE/TadG family type IV pilus assembly protein [Arthrobacter sp. CAL618]|uniref:TadE/TadG family type IV pilus assembly protein n=1 Tax=Arthrobacter sp. CAL618 TaxID=1055770 RepID=UPI0003F6981E|nr:TadE family protein [Arthrobacter sp. CAL618]